MAELQPIARDGRMSQLGSCYPNGGDELNTSSTLPIRLHPGHCNSPQAPSAPVTTPLIPCRPHGHLTRRRFCQDLWDCNDPRLPSASLGGGGSLSPSPSGGRTNTHIGRRRLASAKSTAEPTEVSPRMTLLTGIGVLLCHPATKANAQRSHCHSLWTPRITRLPD